tara:strand:- start:3136 stop:4065 length:930 start_codon:yes stop_codon:yes gene_type:complete
MKIIVTGGCGFIGQNLVQHLYKLGGEEIWIVDEQDKIHQNKTTLSQWASTFIEYKEFISHLSHYLESGDVIFHQGACTDTMNYKVDEMMYKNFEYSKSLFEHCRLHNIRMIYASSAAVYGLGFVGESYSEKRCYEAPINLYAESKLLFDNYVRCFNQNYPQIVGLRYFNVYGPGEAHKEKMASVIYQFYKQAVTSKEVRPFKKSEEYLRDFIYIDDIVNINLYFYKNPQISGIFNCGTGSVNSFMDIVKEMKNHLNFDVKEIEMPLGLLEKYQIYTRADLYKLKKAGYNQEFVSLTDGISRYLKVLHNE